MEMENFKSINSDFLWELPWALEIRKLLFSYPVYYCLKAAVCVIRKKMTNQLMLSDIWSTFFQIGRENMNIYDIFLLNIPI